MQEGSRLMRAAYHALLRRGEVSLDVLMKWIESFARTPDGKSWGFGDLYSLEFCDTRAVNAKSNVCEALRSLYFLLKDGMERPQAQEPAMNAFYAFLDRPINHRDELIRAVDSVLRPMYGRLYPEVP